MVSARSFVSVGVFLLFITGCGLYSVESRRETALNLAMVSDLKPFRVQAGQFQLAGFSRFSNPDTPIVVYIEGDGLAWIDRHTISDNPTPENPVALLLAAQDRSANVVYLARPCQYVDLKHEQMCQDKYWTSHRFSAEVIKSYQSALDILSRKYTTSGFHLVGYSGGGALAALLAGKRSDVLSMRTVAGNLNHVSLNQFRRVSPLQGSLDPMRDAIQTKNIPQVHYVGGEDKVIPEWISQSYAKAVGNAACVSTHVVPHATHHDGWKDMWATEHRKIPVCK